MKYYHGLAHIGFLHFLLGAAFLNPWLSPLALYPKMSLTQAPLFMALPLM